jgi:hypothetical protein
MQTLPLFEPDITKTQENSHNRVTLLRNKARLAAAHDKDWVGKRFNGLKYSLSIIGLTIAGWFKAFTLKIFPKRYTADEGVIVDWQSSAVNKLKIAVPVFVAAFILALAVLSGPLTWPGNKGVNNQNTPATPVSATNTKNGQGSNNSSGSNGSGNTSGAPSPVSPVAPVNTATPAPASGVSTPQSTGFTSPPPSTGGGMGGGYGVQAPTPTPTPSPINSLPPTTTVTVPPTQLQAGDKPVLSTDGFNVTVN